MNLPEIEEASRLVLKKIWHASRHKFSQEPSTASLRHIIDPGYACHLENFSLEYRDSLGSFGWGGDRFEVAGAFNRQKREILISKRFTPECQRFTAAHELGHLFLHTAQVMHRDRPISGLDKYSHQRPQEEKEADYFAACFLMPRNLVLKEFTARFGKPPFKFDENSSFLLAPNEVNQLLYCDPKSLDRELALATCGHFGMRPFIPLAKLFDVSNSSMAIRLQELGVVRWP